MDKAISTKIKKILKARASKAKISYKSPKQVAKQSQVVIINQDRPKRRYTRRGKATGGGGGGGGSDPKIVYIPTSFPNFNIPAQNPQAIRQEIPQMVREFQPTPVYRNPLRIEPFRSALNPPPFNQNKPAPANIEGNLDEIPLPSPPPLEPEIVLEPNRIFMPSTPVSAYPIMSSSSPTQGFTQLEAVNQLNNQDVQKELNAYSDFGGYDAQAEDEARRTRLAKQLSAGEMYSQPMSESESETASIRGGGGGGREEKEGRKYSGRGPSKLSQEEIMSLTSYYRAKLDKNYKNLLQSTDAGKIVFTEGGKTASAKKNNPYVMALKEDITNKYGDK